MEYPYLYLIGAVFLVCVIAKIILVGHRSEPEQAGVAYQYSAKNSIMSFSESEFFKTLVGVAGDRYYVFPQVHLSALLNEKTTKQDWRSAFRHINGKSVDYVLCDKVTLKPVYAVELDDKTHEQSNRQKRDEEVARIFKGANIPLVRFSDFSKLSEEDVTRRLYEAHIHSMQLVE